MFNHLRHTHCCYRRTKYRRPGDPCNPRRRGLSLLVMLLLLPGLPTLAAAQRTNLLVNADFESQPLAGDWSVFAGEGELYADNSAHGGSTSARVSNRGAFYGGVAQDIRGRLTPGVTYDVSAWVRLANPAAFDLSNQANVDDYKFLLNIKQKDASGTRYVAIDSSSFEDPNDWVKLFGQFTYSPNGTPSELTFYVHGPAPGVEILVDDVAILGPVDYSVAVADPADFVRADGRSLVVGANNDPIRLMGVNFNAYGDEDEAAESVYTSDNYDAVDYQRVAAMGLTVVRLDLWWKLFEDENNPYSYKDEGWDWLNKNIVWARDAGVSVILDMHAPHGGFQGPGYSGNFWSNNDYQARTRALWREIAARYKNETVVAAYDLFNEPAAPTTSQLAVYTQQLVDDIRGIDSNHLLIVEMDYGDEEAQFLIDDPATNVMYDFHQYNPWRYSAALGYHYGYGDYGVGYPNPNAWLQPYENDKVDEGLVQNSPIPNGDSDWTWYEGTLMSPPNANVWGALPVLFSDGNSGTVQFDEFVVDEYDAAGSLVRRIQHIDPDPKPSDWWMLYETHIDRDPFVSYTADWGSAGLGGSGNRSTSSDAHRGSRSLTISASNGSYGITNQKLRFAIEQGHQYRISGWIKGSGVTGGGAGLALRWYGFKSWDTPKPFNRATLEQGFFDNDGLQFFIDANVPVNIGEFGTAVTNFANGRGGLNWVRDMLDIMDGYQINGQYFHYHSAPWGIYYNVFGFPKADHYNQPLAGLFASRGYRDGVTNPVLYSLSVANGSGDGDYAAGNQVPISADPAPAGQQFDAWTGDTAGLADPAQASTTLTMPAATVTISASYRDLPALVYSLSVNNGSGDGDYAVGSEVAINADPAPAGQQFDAWTGDIAVVADPSQASTTLTMPAAVVNLTAGYRDIPASDGADLRISLSSDITEALVGKVVVFTFITVNDGPDTATGVATVLDLPFDFEWVWGSSGCAVNQWGEAACSIGTIGSGAQRTRKVGVRVQEGGDFSVEASVDSDQDDPDWSNNDASMDLSVSEDADIRVTIEKSYPSGDPRVNRVVNLRTRTYNDGPAEATNAVMTLQLPWDSELYSMPSSCSLIAAGEVNCPFGTLSAGARRTRTIKVRVLELGVTEGEASAESDSNDPDWDNNTATQAVTVVP